MEMITKDLFKRAMKAEWKEVVEVYKVHSEIHKAKITRSGDTALHIAVSDGKEDVVEELVKVISETSQESWKALQVQNDRGNTPLHFAASMGSVRMCQCIASRNPQLIGARNNDNETPFFLAAHQGKKDAFLCLHSHCNRELGYLYCRRNDGETILHSAINGDYFDLAFHIINLYENLVNSVNQQGFSPLHLLASKPSAFRSGSHLGRFHTIIYHCTFVDELRDESSHQESSRPKIFEEKNYPENYRTCISFFQLLTDICRVLTKFYAKKHEGTGDAENPERKQAKKNEGTGDAENPERKQGQQPVKVAPQRHQLFPENYQTCFDAIKLISKATLIILGLGSREITKIQERKKKHVWSVQIMNKLLQSASMYEYEDNGRNPQLFPSGKDGETLPYSFDHGTGTVSEAFPDQPQSEISTEKTSAQVHTNKEEMSHDIGEKEKTADTEQGKTADTGKRETPILIAAKNGVTEMVEKILQLFPVAINDVNSDNKNIVLLAVEHRQPHVYQFLLDRYKVKDSVFRMVDKDGNSALHLAATLGQYRPWLIPGAALQMQWEIKWYEFVKNSMRPHFFVRHNKKRRTAKDIFTETHNNLVTSGGDWLTNTSESCSVVAALIATVAFATSSTVPGGVKEGEGTPTLENEPAFNVFAISSLVALCFSVTAVIMFLAILTSRYQEKDFGKDLPRKLLVGLTSLLVSIASMLISFCSGHFFVLKDQLKYAAFPVYAVTCLPVTFFAIAQFPLYFDLIWATFKKVPQRSYKEVPL
ncbi:hypothetical protein F0562_021222 [Nyssa sinensis]|uniref:PGG domain-containing protein n=1 Tax=Nyssa sinensis TaxID=561372 RepID=A0A5J5BJL3_9ASTE|nr:hypothetical protein F0562_021222 [Nyssa sinensis]